MLAVCVGQIIWLARLQQQVAKFGRLLLKVRVFLKRRHKWTGG